VTNSYSGLQIIDISDPANPTFKGSYNTPGNAHGVALFDNHAYVADWASGLQIIDVSDPSNPTFKGSYDALDYALGVALSWNYAYVANYKLGLQIIDISDPANPIFKGSCDTPDYAREVALSGNYAYIAGDLSGLHIIALNPDKLILSGTPSSIGTYSVDIEACNEIMECVSDSFYIIVENNAPIVANPLQNQTALVNTLFNYIFPTNTFVDPDGDSLAYTAKLSDDSPLPSWLNFDSLQRKFFGTPNTFTTHSIKVTASDNYGGSISNGFNIQVINNAPIVANPLQNQTATINALFNYVFSTDTFIDPDGHPLTYTAKSSNNEPLPSWLNFNSSQRKFSGTPDELTTYPIKVTASDNYGGSISTMFNLIVKDSSIIDDTTDIRDLTTILVIIGFGSMTIGVCIAYIAISYGIAVVRRRRNKISRDDSNITVKEQSTLPKISKEKEKQKPKATIPNENTQNVSMISKYKKDEELLPYKASMCPKEKKEIETLSYEASKVLKGEVELDELLYRSMVHEHKETHS
jgi:hypothetical protein